MEKSVLLGLMFATTLCIGAYSRSSFLPPNSAIHNLPAGAHASQKDAAGGSVGAAAHLDIGITAPAPTSIEKQQNTLQSFIVILYLAFISGVAVALIRMFCNQLIRACRRSEENGPPSIEMGSVDPPTNEHRPNGIESVGPEPEPIPVNCAVTICSCNFPLFG